LKTTIVTPRGEEITVDLAVTISERLVQNPDGTVERKIELDSIRQLI
jgi:hypothetical protein